MQNLTKLSIKQSCFIIYDERKNAKKKRQEFFFEYLIFIGFIHQTLWFKGDDWWWYAVDPRAGLGLFSGTSRTEPGPGCSGTCRRRHGPRGWSQQGSTWPAPGWCCGPGSVRGEIHIKVRNKSLPVKLYLFIYLFIILKALSYPEVSGVHSELEGVQLAQFGQGTAEVIDLSHGLSNGSHDGGSVLLHLRRVRAQIGPVSKVGLGLRGGDQHPGKHKQRDQYIKNLLNC